MTLILTTQCTYKENTEARSRKQCYRGKGVCITYSECVCVLSLRFKIILLEYHSISTHLSNILCRGKAVNILYLD
jgi:hypothetical protein